MSTYLVASDSFVVTNSGPVVTRDLVSHDDKIMIVRRDGRLAFSALSDLEQGDADHLGHRIFTNMGDIFLPEGSDILMKGSPLSGAEIEDMAQRDSRVKVEIVNVHHVRTNGQRGDKTRAYQQCLAELRGRAVALPREVAETNGIGEDVEEILEIAGAVFERFEDERWVAYDIDPSPRPLGRHLSAHHATALMLLTAWASDTGSLVSRTRTEETMLRRNLIAGLVAQGSPFETTWVPGYHPVECRLRLLEEEERRAYRSVTAAFAVRHPVYRLVTADPGALVVNLMIVPASG